LPFNVFCFTFWESFSYHKAGEHYVNAAANTSKPFCSVAETSNSRQPPGVVRQLPLVPLLRQRLTSLNISAAENVSHRRTAATYCPSRFRPGWHRRSGLPLLEKELFMVKVSVKGGTSERFESLCRTCSQGHIITGFRATEEEVFCRTFYIEREIHFPVRECTFYKDRRLASKEEMEEIAWHLRTTTTRPCRDMGFVNPHSTVTEAHDGEPGALTSPDENKTNE
jgi:hypothetical protein